MVVNPLRKRWVVGALGAVASSMAAAADFSAPMETSRWQVDASVFACKLYQPLRLYGEAVFLRRAGEPQRFYLAESNRQLAPGEAAVSAGAPPWEAIYQNRQVATVAVLDSPEPVQLDWPASQSLAGQLQAGRQLTFSQASSWHRDSESVSVVLAPIRFRAAFAEFQQCLGGLLPANYDQVKRSTVLFPAGSEEFDENQREQLDNLVKYVLADRYVTALVIDGHTDGMGLRAENLELSKKRAEMIQAYLLERGVAEDLVTLRWHGERYPVASNRTRAGQAENRRVTVRVDRFEPDSGAVLARNDKP